MAKHITALLAGLFLFTQCAFCQTPAMKIPELTGNVNDFESLFTDAQKSQIDSVITIFAYQTNIPISVITFGPANTTKENSDEFIQQTDSVLYQHHGNGTDVAIFLSKEFRVLSFKANAPARKDTSNLAGWKAKMQQVFTGSVQQYIPLLKDGKYAEAIVATIADLGVTVKKEF